MGKVITFTIALIVVIVMAFVAIVVRTFCIVILWDWYVVPLFNVPSLHLAQAFGLTILINIFHPPFTSSKEDRTFGENLEKIIVAPLFAVFLGWIGTFFL